LNPGSRIKISFTFEVRRPECRDMSFAEVNGYFARNLRSMFPMAIVGLPGRLTFSQEILFE
jgi:hypothetical protein